MTGYSISSIISSIVKTFSSFSFSFSPFSSSTGPQYNSEDSDHSTAAAADLEASSTTSGQISASARLVTGSVDAGGLVEDLGVSSSFSWSASSSICRRRRTSWSWSGRFSS